MAFEDQLAIAAERVRAAETPVTVLVAEDNPVSQIALRGMLAKWGYPAVLASDGEEALRILSQPEGPTLAILDWMMPGLDGVEICRRVRRAGREPYVYIILLTARTEAQDLVEGMEAGADDYLTKPFQVHELRVRLRAGRRLLELQRELLAAREELRLLATHDGLTGLLNRAAAMEFLDSELARAEREARACALLMVDLDRFKQINDTLGHLAGDAVLRETARRMKAASRRGDTLGRYGGEEFLLVLPGTDENGATAQSERIRRSIAEEPYLWAGKPLAVTCSIGVAARPPSAAGSGYQLVGAADEAMYRAKREGRNRVALAAHAASVDRAAAGHGVQYQLQAGLDRG